MSKKRAQIKPWVHIEPGPMFDQTNGAMHFDQEDERLKGMSDAERIAYAGAIGGIAQIIGNG